MSNKIIQTITLKLGGKDIVVNKEDAKKLYAELHELFGEKVVTLPPVYVEREYTKPHWWPSHITCQAESDSRTRTPLDVPMLRC